MNRLFHTSLLALLSIAIGPAHSAVQISEFMAENLTSAIVDEDGEHSDWLELKNTGSTPATLNGWYLTDSASNLQKWRFPLTEPAITLAPGAFLVVWCSSKDRRSNATKLHTNFKLDAGGEYLALVQPDGLTVEHAYGPTYPPQIVNGTYGITQVVITESLLAEGATGKAKVAASAADFSTNFPGWNSSTTFNDSAWQSGGGGFGFGPAFTGLFGTSLEGQMAGVNASCFIRYIVNLPAGTNLQAARLKIKYDDAYIAYINGTKIASSAYATASPAWNSATVATIDRPDGQASSFEIPSSYTNNPLSLLVPGDNVIAFHLMNDTANVNNKVSIPANALLNPQFEIDVAGASGMAYLTSATLGAPNAAYTTAIGPSISEVTDQPPRPSGNATSAPIVVTAKVRTTLSPLAAAGPVVLKYRVAYGNEQSLTMLDDGAGAGSASGDLIAGNGVFTCKIPTISLGSGQMIRWRIEAKDSGSPATYSYAPPYPFSSSSPPTNPPPVDITADLDQYFGTVSQDGITTSNLPILYWFANNTTNADSSKNESAIPPFYGESCSFFFQPIPLENPPPGYVPPAGRFYDNIPTNRHGQSSGGFPKKSNNAGFNKDNRFEWKDGEPAVRNFNLLTNYADKAKVRNPTAWWAWEKSGHIASHFDATVRVQRNASFHGIYDIVEDGSEDFLQREGLDELGALYKVYNSLENANETTNNSGGSEKKNPGDHDFSDLQAFVNGINSAQYTTRLSYVYDNVDVPSLINFLAVNAVILNRDFGHKNYYVYRDTHGTGDWAPLPWDQDLSLGHTWNGSGGGYFDDDIHSQGPFQLGTGNRLMQIVYNTPELNALFVARIRSLADQFFVSPTETNGPMAQKINEILNIIDPNPNNPAGGVDDADLETRRWGFWVDGSGTQIAYTDPRMVDQNVRTQAARILSSNPVPPNPGANPYANWGDGSTSLLPFITGRRDFMFKSPPATSGTIPLPPTQPQTPTLVIEQITFNPQTGVPVVMSPGFDRQDYEYFVIRNPNAFAVDISGWTLSNEVEMTFCGGTVIPAQGAATTQGTNAAYVNQLIVSNNPAGLRTRTASPRANEYRYVTGPYKGQLSARGGTIVLSRPNDPMNPAAGYSQVTSLTYGGTPTQPQQFLRVTELNYHPADPTPGELAALTGVTASEFEFIEITNSGATAMILAGAKFARGVDFTFPTGAVSTIAPGARRLIVSNLAGFHARYGTGLDSIILGEFEDNLSNSGEELQILDPDGEVVLEFTYSDQWYEPTDGDGRTLVTRVDNTAHSDFGKPTSWAIGGTTNGTPGSVDTTFGNDYGGWRWDFFTEAELTQPTTVGELNNDEEGDRLTNFEEYVFARNPRVADHPGALATAGTVNVGGSDHLTITFDRVSNALDVTFFVEAGSSLTSWPDAGILVSTTALGNGRERVTFRDPVPLATGGRQMRVRAVKP